MGWLCAYGEAQGRRLIISLSIVTRDHGHKFEAAGTTILRLAGMPLDICLLEACQDMLIVSKVTQMCGEEAESGRLIGESGY